MHLIFLSLFYCQHLDKIHSENKCFNLHKHAIAQTVKIKIEERKKKQKTENRKPKKRRKKTLHFLKPQFHLIIYITISKFIHVTYTHSVLIYLFLILLFHRSPCVHLFDVISHSIQCCIYGKYYEYADCRYEYS